MRRIIFLFLFCALRALAADSINAVLPTTCTLGDTTYLQGSARPGEYYCSATNTWTRVVTGGAVATASSKSLTVNNTLTLAGTDSTTMTFPSTSATIARTDAANTFTGHQTIEGVTSTGATGAGKFVYDTSPSFTTDAASPKWRSTAAKVLFQGTGSGATQLASTQTTVPTCSSNCGTSPSVAGSDSDGIVTMGGSGSPASAWVVTFNGTWAAAPACVVQSALASMVVGKMPIATVTTTTTMTVTTNGTAPSASDKYQYICRGTS
jgi:mucin-22